MFVSSDCDSRKIDFQDRLMDIVYKVDETASATYQLLGNDADCVARTALVNLASYMASNSTYFSVLFNPLFLPHTSTFPPPRRNLTCITILRVQHVVSMLHLENITTYLS